VRTLALAPIIFVCCVGCSSTPPTPTGPQPGDVIDEGNYSLTVLAPATPATCDVHASSPSHFTDATAEFGLSNVALGGFYSADLDHDGYPDLVLVSGSQKRGTVGSATPDVLVLMNRPAGGGRTLVDETQTSGLFATRDGSTTETRVSDLVAFADVDGDGNLDAFSGINFDPANPVADKNEVMINDGQGHFTFAAASDPSSIVEPNGYQAVYTDIDNDGALDLLTTYWYKPNASIGSQQQLFHGNGDGTFSAITQAAGLQMNNTGSSQSILQGTSSRPSFGAMACDLDGDGYPEILVSSYGGESNLLYKNDGSGNYARIAKGAFDGDTIVDYHDNEYFKCYCTAHASDAYCTGAAKPAIGCPQPVESYWQVGLSDSPAMANGNNFSAACRDIDGDGKPDLFQGTIRHWWAGNATDPSQILHNDTIPGGDVTLSRVDSTTSGITYPHLDPLGWNEGIQQTSLVDMDNDGRVDILNGGSDYAYQYGHLFIQQTDGTFQDLAQQWGMIFPCMDGLAVADYDRDGDLDVVVRGSLFRDCATGWKPLAGKDPGFAGYKVPEVHIFTNDASEHASWLEVRLASTDGATNKMGIGAKVAVTVNGVTQVQEVQGSHGIGSESDDPGVLFFGLGACAAIEKIVVTWPNQAHTQDTWVNAPSNHFMELRQGDATLYGVNLGK